MTVTILHGDNARMEQQCVNNFRDKGDFLGNSVTPLHSVVMAPPVHREVELGEEKDLLCKCKRPKFSGSIVQSQQQIEVPAMEKEKKGHGVLSLEVSVDKKPMDGVTDFVVQSTGEGNSFSKGVHGSASKEPAARPRLNTICSAIGWKDPSYEFEEQGPPHNKLFTCKVTVHVDTITRTVVESLSEPKRQKKAALEHAAQGALWCLKRFGHVN